MKFLALFLVIAVSCISGKSIEGPRRALVVVQGNDINGKIMLEQASINSPVKIRGVVYGMEPGLHSLHVHAGKSLGANCENVGEQFLPNERRETERPAGLLGNVKTFSGSPSRTDISLISSQISLYDETSRNVLNRALVIHVLPDDLSRVNKQQQKWESDLLADSSRILGCGLIRPTEVEQQYRPIEKESILLDMEKSHKIHRIEESILNGEKPWENVRHPYFGAAEQDRKVPSNLNLEGVERQDQDIDSLTLESAVPTRKVWIAGYTYEYDYAGWIATGIMGISNKVSGGAIKGRLVIEPVDENTVNVALLNTKAKQFNEDVMEKFLIADPGQEVRIVDQQHLEKPMQIKIVSGKVESVAIGKEEPLWIVNFKRALAAQIQMQLDESSGVFQKDEYNNYYAENTVYHTMEGCSTGECQTWYHISRLPVEQIETEEEKLLPVPELCENFPVYEIVKNRDFDKCRVLPVFNYLSPAPQCDVITGAGCENTESHVSTTRIIGCTNEQGHFIVQRIKTVDKLVSKPLGYETEAIEGQSIQHFHLKSARHSGSSKLVSRISQDVHIYQTLAYSYDSDYQTHGPLMGKPTLRNVNSPMVMEVDKSTLISEAERLWNEIVRELENQALYVDPSSKYIPDKINMLRRVLSSLDYPELVTVVSKTIESNIESAKSQVMIDALVLSGTNPAFLILRDLITKGKITGEQAANVVAFLPGTIQTPTKELLSTFFELLKSQAVQTNRQLEITTALSLSRLVYQACVNTTLSLNMYPKLVMGEFCSPSDSIVSKQLVPFLYEQAKTASDAGERIAFLTALSNVGHEMIVPYIKPFITSCEPSSHYENEWYERNQRDLSGLSKKDMKKKWIQYRGQKQQKEEFEQDEFESQQQWASKQESEVDWEDEAQCNIVRAQAIFALSTLAEEKKEIVGTLLMPVFFNKAEETEVRLAALAMLFRSNPSQAFWNRVALSTWYEPNDQVAHFIYTTIASKVANKDPVNREETVRAEAALPLMKPFFWTSYVALNYFKAGYAEKTRLGYQTETTTFPGYESFIPSHIYNRLTVNAGPWVGQALEIFVDSKHAEKFVDRLLGKPGVRSMQYQKDESSITSPELQKIREALKVEARATGQPEMYIYVNLLENYQRFFTVTPSSLMKVVEKQLMQKLRQGSSAGWNVNFHKFVPIVDTFYRVPSAMGLAYTLIGEAAAFISVKSTTKVNVEGIMSRSSVSAEIEGTIQPIVQVHVVRKMMTETPFARTYPVAGIHMDLTVALPGSFSVEADIKTGKLQTSWEFLGDKVRVFHRSVTPYTSVMKVGDFTPALLLKETEISTPVESPKMEKSVFGEKSLGLNFIFTQIGDEHAINSAIPYTEDFFGLLTFLSLPSTIRHHEQSLILDNSNSETKSIKTFLSFAAKSTVEAEREQREQRDIPMSSRLHTKSLFESVYGDKLKVNKWVKQEQEQEWNTQKFQHVFQSLYNPSGYTLDFTAELTSKSSSIKSRRFGSSIVYGMDSQSTRSSIMMEKRHELESDSESNFVLCADIDAKFPDFLIFKRKEMIKDEDYEPTSIVKIGYGKSCTDDRKVTFTTKWARSEDQITPTLRSKWQQTQCQKHEKVGRSQSDECVAARRLNSFLNKAVVTVDFNEVPAVVKNITNKIENIVQYFYAPYMSENVVNVNNGKNQITVESLYYPLVGSMDVKVYLPEKNTFYHNIEVHPVAEVFLPKRMALTRPTLAAPGVCRVGTETVTTFDGLHYNATISGCDQVLTKDCSGRYQMAVLSREVNDKKIVTVLLDNEKIEIFPAQQKVKVNGQEISVSGQPKSVKNAQNEIVAIVKKAADNFIQVESPVTHMITVLTDGQEVVVLGSPIHRGRLCGLCGSQTGNKLTDLEGPRQCTIPKDLLDAAYEIKNSPVGCKSEISSAEVSQVRRIQEECLKEESQNVFGSTKVWPLLPKFQQNAYSSQVVRRPTQWTTLRNKMIVQDGKRCFSTEPVVKCVEGSQPVDTEEQKLGFHCIAKNQLSEKLSEELSRRPLDELMGKEVDTIRVFNVPTLCVPAY